MNYIKRKVLTIIITILELMILSGCQYFSFLKKEKILPYKGKDSEEFSKTSFIDYETTYYDLMKDNHHYLNSKGENKILIIPILIYEYLDNYNKEESINDLNQVFFGIEDSLSSFYYKTSYSNLKITGEVFSPLGPYSYNSLMRNEKVLLNDLGAFLNEELVGRYDNDNNQKIDYVSFIYFAPPNSNTNYWAHTVKSDSLILDNYSFISIDFIYDNEMLSISTISHELGHALGLDDYYNKDNTTFDPLGKMDMMSDCTLYFNPLSKFILGWAKPVVFNGTDEITIRPFDNNQYFLLIGNNYNQNPYSEYIIVECFNDDKVLGAKLYHVDARIYYSNDGVNKILSRYSGEENPKLSHSNTPSYSPLYHTNNNGESYIPLIELIDKRGKSHLKYDYDFSFESLFTKGDTINLKDISFYGGKGINFNIVIKDLGEDYITIIKE